jgi:hypothetical protein
VTMPRQMAMYLAKQVTDASLMPKFPKLRFTRLTRRSKRLPCPDYLRLRQLYESALRYWAQLQQSLITTELVGETAGYAAQLKNDASTGRDAAKQRLFEHWWTCSICKESALATRTKQPKDPKP